MAEDSDRTINEDEEEEVFDKNEHQDLVLDNIS